MVLRVPVYNLANDVYMDILKTLESKPIRLDYDKTEISIYTIPTGVKQHLISNILPGRNPSNIMVILTLKHGY